MAGKIFINYRRDDSDAEALNVAQYLENTFGKNSIFIDVDRMRAGQKFATVLEHKLGQCKVLLAIIGPNWVDVRDKTGARRLDNPDDWVRLEIERSLARNIPVIPVLVAGASLPTRSDLPPSLQPLVEHQCASVTTNGFRHEMAGLAHDVAELTRRRPWGRATTAASALVLGGYVAAHQLGAPVWWPPFLQPYAVGKGETEAEVKRSADGKAAEAEAKRNADAKAAEAEAKRNADAKAAEAEAKRSADAKEAEATRNAEEARRDLALSLTAGSGKTFQDRLANGRPCPMCPEMVVVPAGEFLMGAAPSEIDALTKERPNDAERWNRAAPQRKVTIPRPIAIGRFAVTFAEWDACVADNGCNGHEPNDVGWGRGKQPVIDVNWDHAKAYAVWLSRKTGKRYRLLSEAEREYAARAGTTTAFWWGSSISTSQANYNGNYTFAGGAKGEYRGKTVPVDTFAPNPWGLYQVHGNILEWVEDCWHENYQGAPSDGSAWTGACTEGSWRLVRGGSWRGSPHLLRAADRARTSKVSRLDSLGFRLARMLNP